MDVSHNERNMAALAQSLGVLAALPVWLRWRNRSAFVRAHAAQSIVFDGMTVAALIVVAALAIGVVASGYVAFLTLPRNIKDVALLFLVAICAPGMTLIGSLVVLIAALVLRLRAAIAANQGRPFHYPLLAHKTLGGSETPSI
jgi:uncharacterized Tic20 family protein